MIFLHKILIKIIKLIKVRYYNSILTNTSNFVRIYGRSIEFIYPQNIFFGKNCGVNNHVYLNAEYPIEIGDNVALSESVKLITVTLDYTKDQMNSSHIGGAIKIGNNVQIGAGAIVLPNVIIGNNVVVGAGSIVTKDVTSNTIVAGNPAKLIKKIN
jgi:maltose O-acetyltransferase